MKIINKTHWRTDHIRAIATIVAKDENLEKHQIKALKIFVEWKRRADQRLAGWAYIGCNSSNIAHTMYLFMNKEKCDSVALAHVIAHEIGHLKGLRHRDMKGSIRYTYAKDWRQYYAWASYLPVHQLPPRPVKPAPTVTETTELEFTRAAAMVAQWKTKVKRANTMLKKWERRARHQQKRLAALKEQPS